MEIQVSLIASSVRYQLYNDLFRSLEGTSVEYEVVFVGNKLPRLQDLHPRLRYIETGDITPAQCYEIARREAKGETVQWTADDAEYPNDVLGKADKYWKGQNNRKLILSIQTRESGYKMPEGELFPMNQHTLLARDTSTPLMAPLALMSREYLKELGGFDRRYICGQYENDVVMNAYADGGTVEIFGGPDCFIDLDHLGKSIRIGECKDENDFLNRPFATGYKNDRAVLLKTWCNYQHKLKFYQEGDKQYFTTFFTQEALLTYKDVLKERGDTFEPYEDEDILTKSQSNKGKWK